MLCLSYAYATPLLHYLNDSARHTNYRKMMKLLRELFYKILKSGLQWGQLITENPEYLSGINIEIVMGFQKTVTPSRSILLRRRGLRFL